MALRNYPWRRILTCSNPFDYYFFNLVIFVLLKLHISDTKTFGCNMGAEHTFMEIETVLDEERITYLIRTDDVVTITTIL